MKLFVKNNKLFVKTPVMSPKRRTEAEKKEILNLVKSIVDRVAKFEITSYELGKANEVEMTGAGIEKILNGTTKRSNISVLKQIDNYLIKNYETEKVPHVAEPNEKYGSDNFVQEIINLLKILDNKLDKISLKQDINFELIKSSKAAALDTLNEKYKVNS